MAGVSDWILPIVLLGAGYYEFVIRNGQDVQNLLHPSGDGAGGTPCMGKDSTGAACPCTTSSVAYSYPVFAYRSKKSSYKKKSSSKKSSGGGGYGSKSTGGGGTGSTTTSAPASTGSCDCSACTGGSTNTTTAGGNIWVQDPAFNAKTLPCPTLGQACSPAGARGGTSGPNKWCLCGGSGTKKTTSKTGGVGTVEGFAGMSIGHEAWGLPAVLY